MCNLLGKKTPVWRNNMSGQLLCSQEMPSRHDAPDGSVWEVVHELPVEKRIVISDGQIVTDIFLATHIARKAVDPGYIYVNEEGEECYFFANYVGPDKVTGTLRATLSDNQRASIKHLILDEVQKAVSEFVGLNDNLLSKYDAVGCTVYQMTVNQFNSLQDILAQRGYTLTKVRTCRGITEPMGTIFGIRHWLHDAPLYPGAYERDFLIRSIEIALSKEDYSELDRSTLMVMRERLMSINTAVEEESITAHIKF